MIAKKATGEFITSYAKEAGFEVIKTQPQDLLQYVVEVNLDDLQQDEGNPRQHNLKNISLIQSSIEKVGQYRPFVVNKRNNQIAIGNGMYAAMKNLGITKANAIFLDLSESEFRALSIVDNRASDTSIEDAAKLLSALKSIPEELAGLTGYDTDDITIMEYELACNNHPGISGIEYEVAENDEKDDLVKFVFSSLHFKISQDQYIAWINKNGFNEMDAENVKCKLLQMIGIK